MGNRAKWLGLALGALCSMHGCAPAPAQPKCPCVDTRAAVVEGAPTTQLTAEVLADAQGRLADLTASASRHMMHGRGRACLEDLAKVRELDPRTDRNLTILRAQCEMLDGHCQAGKARVRRWYAAEMAFAPGRSADMADSLAALRCRGGDSTPADLVRVAVQQLSEGAHVDTVSADHCRRQLRMIERHGIEAAASETGDVTTIRSGVAARYYTGARCLARAGDCDGAWEVWEKLNPAAAKLASLSEKDRTAALREAFESTVPGCDASVRP